MRAPDGRLKLQSLNRLTHVVDPNHRRAPRRPLQSQGQRPAQPIHRVGREGIKGVKHADETGGLSGAPVKNKSTHTIKVLAQTLQGKLPIIGVGGILNGEDAAEKLRAGASLVQIYSGFIYRGPQLIHEACAAIRGSNN